jgi:MFS family permease
LGVLLLVNRVAEQRPGSEASPTVRIGLAAAVRMMASRPQLRRILVASGLLSVMTISDAFVYLTLLERGLVPSQLFPLLFLATSLVYLAAAVPFGRLADRYGRNRLFLAGHGLILLAYLVVGLGSGLPGAGIALLLLGLYYAATDGVLPAATATLVPSQWRSTAISTVQTAVALGRSLAALVFGALWTVTGPGTALWLFAGGLAAVLVIVAPTLTTNPNGDAT